MKKTRKEKPMKKIILTIAAITYLIIFSLVSAQAESLADVNKGMQEYCNTLNKLSYKHYGVKIVNSAKIVNGAIIIDYKHQAFEFQNQPIEKQVDMAMDILLDSKSKRKLKKLKINSVRILIDNRFFKEYVI